MASKKLSTDTSLANSYKLSRGVASVARPSAPTIGTATDGGYGVMSVTFTASTLGPTASSFTLTSSSGVTGTGASSPLTLTEVVESTYTYTVSGVNANGTGPSSATSNSVVIASVDPSAYFPIATTTLAAATATVTFSSIPATYTHLQMRIWGFNSSGSDRTLYLQLNSDSGSNYRNHYLSGNGTAASSGSEAAATTGILPLNTNSSQTGFNGDSTKASAVIMDILDYANTNKNTTVRTLGGWEGNGTGYAYLSSGLWMNTAAVSTLYFQLPYSSSFGAKTLFTLYGIKG